MEGERIDVRLKKKRKKSDKKLEKGEENVCLSLKKKSKSNSGTGKTDDRLGERDSLGRSALGGGRRRSRGGSGAIVDQRLKVRPCTNSDVCKEKAYVALAAALETSPDAEPRAPAAVPEEAAEEAKVDVTTAEVAEGVTVAVPTSTVKKKPATGWSSPVELTYEGKSKVEMATWRHR